MADTDTYISWPNKLKIGAKSKKGKCITAIFRAKKSVD